MKGVSDKPAPGKLDTDELRRRVLEAVRRGASMEEMANLHESRVANADDAIQALRDGNARFFTGEGGRADVGVNERRALIMQQTPFAAVLACSDSRVPVELVFDVGLGDLFVVRNAGNVVGASGLGTLEYATEHLDIHLIVVMGHEGCGAVAAALMPETAIEKEPANLRELIRRIQPSVQDLPKIRDKKARMREAVLNNVRYQVHQLRQEPVIQAAEARGQIKVIGAFYEIGSGAVDFLIDEDDLRP